MRVLTAKAFIGLGLSAALLGLGACGNDSTASETASPVPSASASDTPSATPSASTPAVKASNNFDAVKVEGAYGKSPTVTVKAPWAIDKTRTEVLSQGNGAVITAGATVELDYYGVNGRTGKKFDDSFSRGQTLTIPLDQVVPGFGKGLVGQKQGSRVVIAMPGSDGYDASGGSAQAGINVGDTLIFVVDIITVPLTGPAGDTVTPKAGLPTVTDSGGKPTVTVPKTDPPTDLQIQPLIKGKGKKVAATDVVSINYTWLQWSDGKVLEETYSSKPASAPLSQLLPGMQKGLVGQTVGSRVLLVIPPADGYPQGNASPSISANQTLVMVVDILFTASSGQ